MIARFAKNVVFQNGNLICADDDGVPLAACDFFSLLPGEKRRCFAGIVALIHGFINVRRHRLIFRQETIKQAASVL